MKVLDNQFVRYGIALAVGAAIGAIFYPSKSITKEEKLKYEQEISRVSIEKEKVISELHQSLHQEQTKTYLYKEEVQKKVTSLKQENYRLKSKVKESRFKIIKPDGTIEEKWFKESETDVVSSVITSIKSEFTRKVQSIENKWKKIHTERVSKIKSEYEKKLAESEKTKVTVHKKEKIEVNKRSFGISLGITNEKDYFSSVSYDIYGPFFLDLHLESNRTFSDKEIGIGLGLRF